MKRSPADRIADALLYEGYILYPYRPSIKNQQRWTFGGLFPEDYCQKVFGETCHCQTECLVRCGIATQIDVTVRFLHLTDRRIGESAPPVANWPDSGEPLVRFVPSLQVGDRVFAAWQEAEEKAIVLPSMLGAREQVLSHRVSFAFPGRRWLEPIREEGGAFRGMLVREQQALAGVVEWSTVPVAPELLKLTLCVTNRTPSPERLLSRDEGVLRSLGSVHAILAVAGGEFVSLLDPPEEWREVAARCRNIGTWPALVGEEGERTTMLSSPIILEDYPQVAPESPGDLFDCTEIDEILTLRILTLTNEEKQQMASVDERARALLARTECLNGSDLLRLHGAFRRPGPTPEGGMHDGLGA